MTISPIVLMLVGHMVGDYILQNDYQALNKKTSNKACLLHCLLYTNAVVWAMISFLVLYSSVVVGLFAVGVFVSHWILDRWCLVEWWGKTVKGRSWSRIHCAEFSATDTPDKIAARIAYTALVQTAIDNTLHIIMMLVIFSLLF